MAISKDQRGYSSGKYAIDLGSGFAGWISSVEGGNAVADVITEKMGVDVHHRKHLGNVKYEEISFQCGTGMSNGLYDWIQTGFNLTNTTAGRKDGAIVFCDYDSYELSRLEWKFGMMSEVGMPALDAAGKDAAKMSIKFHPEITRRTMKQGSQATVQAFPVTAAKQKLWTNQNFRLRINGYIGLDDGCKKVNKIDAITVKQKITENSVGEGRDYEKVATSMEIPNLVITMTESHSEIFYKWHEDFVIKGNCTQEHEMTGILEYLANDTTTVLFTLNLVGLGIFKITPDKMEAGAEGVRRTKVEMYCEEITYQFGAGKYGN